MKKTSETAGKNKKPVTALLTVKAKRPIKNPVRAQTISGQDLRGKKG